MRPDERDEALQLVEDLQRDRGLALPAEATGAREIPKILLPYQVRWHKDPAVVRICRKGRRVGFTWGAWAAEAVLEAARANGGMDQFYMGYNQGMAAEFIGDCARFARAFGAMTQRIEVGLQSVVIADERRDIVTYKIRLASGRKIEALSSMPHNWRGRQGHARIDEAKDHKDLKAVIDGALAYRIWGGRISIGGTLGDEEDAFTELLNRVIKGSLPWSLHTVRFSDAVREGLYRRICLVTGKTWSPEAEAEFIERTRADYPDEASADAELECIPKRGSGAYFSRLLIEKCADVSCAVVSWKKTAEFVLDTGRIKQAEQWFADNVKPLIDAMPSHRRSVFGQDFGRSGDLSVITVGQERIDALGWRTPFRIELRNIPFDCQSRIRQLLGESLPLFTHAKFDARGNGQSHAEAALQEWGPSRVECVMFTPKWYDTEWPRYRQAYEDGEISTFADEDWISDHRSVVLVGGQPRVSEARVKGSDGHDRHGDAAIAGLLCWAATRNDLVPSAGATSSGSSSRPSRRLSSGRQSTALFGRRVGGNVSRFEAPEGHGRPEDAPDGPGDAPDAFAKIHEKV